MKKRNIFIVFWTLLILVFFANTLYDVCNPLFFIVNTGFHIYLVLFSTPFMMLLGAAFDPLNFSWIKLK